MSIPRVSWAEALDRMDRQQGEHTTLIGPPGRGKTQAMIALADEPIAVNKYSMFFATKRIDDTQKLLQGKGYAIARTPEEVQLGDSNRWIVRPPWPKKMSPEAIEDMHREMFRRVLTMAFKQTGWTLNLDELPYLTRHLKLDRQLILLWLQGRSQGNTMVANTQRPRHVPLEAYESATHLLFFQQHDDREIDRIAEIASFDRSLVKSAVANLDHHDILYANTVNYDVFITNTAE